MSETRMVRSVALIPIRRTRSSRACRVGVICATCCGAGRDWLLSSSLGVVGLYFWASSSRFENIVRKRLIAQIETATGGRAEIGAFHWNLLKLQAEADGVVLHGREPAGRNALRTTRFASSRLRCAGSLEPARSAARPRAGAATDSPDRVPRRDRPTSPSRRTNSKTNVLDTLFDLQASHVEVNHGCN